MSPSDTLLADLSQHENFVRRTLGAILRDHSEVDDVVQETWVRALAHGGLPGRAWLAKTARHIAASRWRSDERRRAREERLERKVAAPSVDSAVQRLEDRQRVVKSVLALTEPYRGVVLMRYEEDMTVAEIASALERSPGTVRSQLSRAHELLRNRLDAEFGDRRQWAALGLPAALAGHSGAAASGVGPALLLTGAVAVVGLAVLAYGALRPASATPSGLTPTVTLEALALGASTPLDPLLAIPTVATHRSRAQATGTASKGQASAATSEDARSSDTRPYKERLMPRAELLARSYYQDYTKATFSFPFGIRDDPGLKLTRNSWSVLFGNGFGQLDFGMPRFKSFVVDLGRIAPQAAADLDIQALSFTEESVTPRVGHSYLVISRDDDSDLASLVHIVEHEPKRRCVFDWYTTDGTGRAQGSITDDRIGRPMVDALVHWRSLLNAGTELKTPEVLLQLRAGAGGGNPNTLDMTGNTSVYVDKTSGTPLDFSEEIDPKDPSVAYSHGGIVGSGRAFVVTSIDYEGTTKGDSNGHGEFRLVVGGTNVAHYNDRDEPFQERWSGRIAVESGNEANTYLEVANSSSGKVRLHGHFEDRTPLKDAPFRGENVGFLGDHEIPEPPTAPPLESARVVLQVRNWRGGGNPHRIDMLGIANMYIRTTSMTPLDWTAPLDSKVSSVAYAAGGSVPTGQRFVVTSARMRGAIEHDRRNSYARLRLGERWLINVNGPQAAVDETWRGNITVVPGDEWKLFLEVADGASIEVVLEGRFEPAE